MGKVKPKEKKKTKPIFLTKKLFLVDESRLFPIHKQLDLKDQRHRGNIDSESPDNDLNIEETEVISESPESLEREIQESREARERLNNFKDLEENLEEGQQEEAQDKEGELLQHQDATEQVINQPWYADKMHKDV